MNEIAEYEQRTVWRVSQENNWAIRIVSPTGIITKPFLKGGWLFAAADSNIPRAVTKRVGKLEEAGIRVVQIIVAEQIPTKRTKPNLSLHKTAFRGLVGVLTILGYIFEFLFKIVAYTVLGVFYLVIALDPAYVAVTESGAWVLLWSSYE